MTRTALPIRPVQWKVSVPADLAASVEELLFDPTTKRPGYGLRSAKIVELLQRWVEEQRNSPALTIVNAPELQG